MERDEAQDARAAVRLHVGAAHDPRITRLRDTADGGHQISVRFSIRAVRRVDGEADTVGAAEDEQPRFEKAERAV